MIAPPEPDELVESLFFEVLLTPDGYEYHAPGGQLLYKVYGNDQWRVLLHKKGTDEIDADNFKPIFIEGPFIDKLTKALHAMQRELNEAVKEFPEPVSKKIQ